MIDYIFCSNFQSNIGGGYSSSHLVCLNSPGKGLGMENVENIDPGDPADEIRSKKKRKVRKVRRKKVKKHRDDEETEPDERDSETLREFQQGARYSTRKSSSLSIEGKKKYHKRCRNIFCR